MHVCPTSHRQTTMTTCLVALFHHIKTHLKSSPTAEVSRNVDTDRHAAAGPGSMKLTGHHLRLLAGNTARSPSSPHQQYLIKKSERLDRLLLEDTTPPQHGRVVNRNVLVPSRLRLDGEEQQKTQGAKSVIHPRLNVSFRSAFLDVDSPFAIRGEGLPPCMNRMSWYPSQFHRTDLLKSSRDGEAVYCGCCIRTGIPVIIKTYEWERLGHIRQCQVKREVTLQARLMHRNIALMYVAFRRKDVVVDVQERVMGQNMLQFLISQGGYLCERTTTYIVIQVLRALRYLHALGIIHRDIKPDNIMIDADCRIKLVDFGLAIDTTLEPPVSPVGTLRYVAPEVERCESKPRHPPLQHDRDSCGNYSSSVDIWSLGILVQDCIMGIDKTLQRSCSFLSREFMDAALCADPKKRPTADTLMSHPWLQLRYHTSETCGCAACVEAAAKA